jgi:hypothetical protein
LRRLLCSAMPRGLLCITTAKPLVCDKCGVIPTHPFGPGDIGISDPFYFIRSPKCSTECIYPISPQRRPCDRSCALCKNSGGTQKIRTNDAAHFGTTPHSKRPYSTLVLRACERLDRKIDRGTHNLIDFPHAPLLLDRQGSPVSSRTRASCLPCWVRP